MKHYQGDSQEESAISTIKAFLRLLLLTPRRWYFVISLVVVLGIKYIYRPALPMPVREYFTTYRIKYSDPGQGERASKSFVEDTYRPRWTMLNPYDRDMAIKYFESTKLVVDAGRKVNYTVRYWYEGQDIYEQTPVDIRFTSDSIDDYDSWSMQVELSPQGVELSKIGGVYAGKSLGVGGQVFVPYDKPTETPLGVVVVRQIRPLGGYTKLSLTKMREVDAQDLYDAKMKRHMGGNLIELFLTADCTRGFARDFFHQIGREYEAYARQYYLNELKTYLERLEQAKSQVASGHDYLEEFGLETKAGDPTVRREVQAQLDRLTEQAQTDALLLGEGQMIEIIDDTFIRSPKQGWSSLPYVNMMLGLLFILLPVIALFVELALRRPVLSPSLLPLIDGKRVDLWRLPKDLSSALEWELFGIQIDSRLRNKDFEQIHIADCKGDKSYTLTALVELMPETLRSRLKVLPALDENLKGLRELAGTGVPIIIRVRCSYTPEDQVLRLYEWAEACDIRPIILWDDRV